MSSSIRGVCDRELRAQLWGGLQIPRTLWFGLPILALMACVLTPAFAQEELDIRNRSIERLDSTRGVAALTTDAFGDQLNLQNGSVIFDVVDIDIPGNNDLPVQLRRRLVIEERTNGTESRGSLGGRDFDVPYLSGMFIAQKGWKVGPSDSDQRCSLTFAPPSTGGFSAHEYWHGYSMHIPGGGDGSLLANPAASLPKPTGSTVYPWITKDFTRLSCLSTTKNGYGGQGFLALTPDGKKYRFDWVVTAPFTSHMRKGFAGAGVTGTYRLDRKAIFILASRVEDRFGNYVDYTYDSNGALTKIESSDGRVITLSSAGNTTTASSSMGAWTYTEAENSATVTRPDGSQWQYAWTGDLLAQPPASDGIMRDDPDCFGSPEDGMGGAGIVYTVTHPSGMKAEFTINTVGHPRYNIPKICNVLQYVAGPGELLNYSWLTIPNIAYNLTLTRKAVTGPGLAPMTWTYTYNVGAGLRTFADKCAIVTNPEDGRCPLYTATEVTAPGKFERYRFGSRYGVNEGQMLQKETGSDPSHILSVERYEYLDPGIAGSQNFPSQVGENPLNYSDDLNTTSLRPQISKSIQRDGAVFWSQVDPGCAGGKYCFDVFARPTKVIKSRTDTGGGVGVGGSSPANAPILTVPAQSITGNYTVNWTAVTGATSYILEEKVGSGAWTQIQNSSATTKAFTGKPAGTYSYRVAACNAAGCGPVSVTKNVVEIDPPTGIPTLTLPTQSTAGSYTASWTTVTGATSYKLEEKVGGGSWTQAQNSSATSKALTGKAAGTYSYRVSACNDAGCGPVSATKSVTEIDPPTGKPTLTLPTQSTAGSYTASWTTVTAATSYKLEEKVGSGSWTQAQNSSAISKAFTGKSAGTYSYRVSACNDAGCGPVSTAKDVVEIDPPASAPTLTAPAQSIAGSYTVSWTTVTGATTYKLEEKVGSGSWMQVQNLSAISKAFTGKSAGTYSYRVSACNDAGCGPVSAAKNVVEIDPPTGKPTLTAPAQSTTGSYTVSWTTVATATSYALEEKAGSGAWTQVQDSSAISKAITGKTAGTYSYRVKACNAAGCGPVSTTKSVVEIDPPSSAPALTVPTQSTTGIYSVSWTAVTTATGYTLEEKFGSSAWAQITTNTGATQTGFTNRSAGTYQYRVKACNAAGCGPYSTVKSLTSTWTAILSAPTGLTAVQNGFMCDVSWNPVVGATTYDLKYGTHPALGNLYSGPDTSVSLDGSCLLPMRVRACNASGCSEYLP